LAQEYAALCAESEWRGYSPREISLADLTGALLPKLRERDTRLGIFYTPTDKGVLPSIDQFEEDLKEELSKIE
jgi:Protein of unknown function (DUF2750)